jgi:cytochrome P450
MKCPRCQQENQFQARFCRECVTPLALGCSNCGTQLPAALMGAVLGDGLLTAEGYLWLCQRRLLQPASHREQVAAHAETMVALEGRGDAR